MSIHNSSKVASVSPSRYPENDTGIVTESGYYDLTEFDQILFVKCVQIFFFVLCSVIIIMADSYIIRTIFQKDNLQTIANVLIFILFITDIGNAVFYTITSSVFIVMGKIWLTESTAKLLSFFSMIFPNLQCLILALASFEKFTYCVYPFKHQRWFSKRNTLVVVGVGGLFLAIYNLVLNGMYEATFYPTIVMCFHNFDTARRIYNKSIMYIILFSFRLSFQFITFSLIIVFQCLTFASSIRTRRRIKCMPASISQHVENRVWRRMFRSAFSLFSVIVLYIALWGWFIGAILKDAPLPVTSQRIGIIFNIFLPSVVNPIANLLGNKPLREAVFKKSLKPSWVYASPTTQNVQNRPGQEHRYQERQIPREARTHKSQSHDSSIVCTEVMEPRIPFGNNGGQACTLVSQIRNENEFPKTCNQKIRKSGTNVT